MNVGELLRILQDYPSDADVCLVDYEIEASVFYQEFNDRHPVGLVEKAGLNVVVLWPHQTCFNCGEVTKYQSCECPACALRRRQDNERLAGGGCAVGEWNQPGSGLLGTAQWRMVGR